MCQRKVRSRARTTESLSIKQLWRRCVRGSRILQHPTTYKDLERSNGICHKWQLRMFQKVHFVFDIIYHLQGSANHVYRVLHCQEGELTQMLSTLSDGWKMNQVNGKKCCDITLFHATSQFLVGEYWLTIFLQ